MNVFKSLIGISLVFSCLNFNLQGQTYAEGALLFSQSQPTGTARILGMGGAQIALGGDPSMALSNPAGLGMANRSSWSISGGIYSHSTQSTFYGETNPGSGIDFNIPQIGIIIQSKSGDESLIGGAFAINFSRVSAITFSRLP